MERNTKALMVSVFIFKREEISHLGLESEQLEFMETSAREDLRKSSLPYIGGSVDFSFGYEFRDSTLTISI